MNHGSYSADSVRIYKEVASHAQRSSKTSHTPENLNKGHVTMCMQHDHNNQLDLSIGASPESSHLSPVSGGRLVAKSCLLVQH